MKCSLPKSYLLVHALTLVGALALEIYCFVTLSTGGEESVALSSLPLSLSIVTAFWLLLTLFLPRVHERVDRFIYSSRKWYKDLLLLLLEQGIILALFFFFARPGGNAAALSSGNPFALSYLVFALSVGALLLYPRCWHLAEEESLDNPQIASTSPSWLTCFRFSSVLLSLLAVIGSFVLFAYGWGQDSIFSPAPLVVGILFLLLFLAQIILWKKGLFERVFAYLTYESNGFKRLIALLLCSGLGLSVYFLANAGSSSWSSLSVICPLLGLDLLAFDTIILPLLILSYPYLEDDQN
jgi:hypothetical protein